MSHRLLWDLTAGVSTGKREGEQHSSPLHSERERHSRGGAHRIPFPTAQQAQILRGGAAPEGSCRHSLVYARGWPCFARAADEKGQTLLGPSPRRWPAPSSICVQVSGRVRPQVAQAARSLFTGLLKTKATIPSGTLRSRTGSRPSVPKNLSPRKAWEAPGLFTASSKQNQPHPDSSSRLLLQKC